MSKYPFFTCGISDPEMLKADLGRLVDSGMLSAGEKVKQFEARFAQRVGMSVSRVVAVNSGTSALHLALSALGIGVGDEVIVPPQTFIATALAVLYTGATVRFCDVDAYTGLIDPKSVEPLTNEHTKAVMPVHWGGKVAGVVALRSMFPWLICIEDAAQALGAHGVGLADATCYSFQATKHLTTGDGGMVTFRNEDAARIARKMAWFGIDREHDKENLLGEREYTLNPDDIGFKYHMNNVAATIGLTGLPYLDSTLDWHQTLACRYIENLNDDGRDLGIRLPRCEVEDSAWWFFPVLVTERGNFVRAMRDRNVPVSVVHQRIDRHPLFGRQRTDLTGMDYFDAHQINLPIHIALNLDDVDWICDEIKQGW